MKRLVTLMAAAAVVAFSGCGASSSSPGGNPTKKSEQVTLKTSDRSITLKQGEAKDVTVTVDRGSDFHEDVVLTAKVKDPDKAKIKVEPMTKDVKSGDSKDVTFSIKTAMDSAEGDHEVEFSGKVKGGNDPSPVTIKVTVKGKK